MTNIRDFINALDSTPLAEASLSDVASSVGDKALSAMGNKKAEGREETRALARYLGKEYKKYLGQLNEKEPSADSLMKFLVSRIGFTAVNARAILKAANIDDVTTTDSPRPVDKSDADKAFEKAAVFAYKHDLVPRKDDEKVTRQHNGGKPTDAGLSDEEKRDRQRQVRRNSRGEPEGSAEDKIRQGVDQMSKDEMTYKVDKTEIASELKKAGINQRYVNDLLDIIKNAKNFGELYDYPARNELLNQLAKVGYAFLRANK